MARYSCLRQVATQVTAIACATSFSWGGSAIAQFNLQLPSIPMPRGLTDAWLETRDGLVDSANQEWLRQRNRIRDEVLASAGIDLQTATALLKTGEFLLDQSTGTLKILQGGLPAVKEVAYSRSKACFAKGPTACLQDIRNGSAAVSAAAACASGGGWSICREAVRLGQLPPANADRFATTIGKVMTEWERRAPSGSPPVPPVNTPVNPPTVGGNYSQAPTQFPGAPKANNVFYPFPVYQTSPPVMVNQWSFGTTNNQGGWNIYLIDGRPYYFSVYVPGQNGYHFFYPNGLRFYP